MVLAGITCTDKRETLTGRVSHTPSYWGLNYKRTGNGRGFFYTVMRVPTTELHGSMPPCEFGLLLPILASRMEALVATVVETSPVHDVPLGLPQAGVALHDRPRAVHETNLLGILEGVVNELGAVGHGKLDAF